MNAPADSDLIDPSESPTTLDIVIEQCVLALERGDFDLDAFVARYPDFTAEIKEFLENWGSMESVAVAISDNEEAAEDLETLDLEARVVDDFQLLQKVGVGGMGTIFKARQISLDRIVALKMIRQGRKDDGRFRMEAEAAASLSHPNIVSIYEIGTCQGRPFFTMQFVAGCDLKEYVQRHDITAMEAARITKTIAEAVHYAHQRGILHRDLKPANVLMDDSGKPYVTDFGLAKHIERDTELTQSGTILGTPGYMAPEQASGKNRNLTMATDVYGLGALLFAMLTGDAPFTGDSSLHILRRVVDEPVTSPRSCNPDVDRDLETICLKCLEKSPELRYSSAQALADDLNRYLNRQPVRARPVTQTERILRWCKRNPVVATLSGTVVALLIATLVFAIFLAISEHNSRILSQDNARRESLLRQDANKALEEEQIALRREQNTRANLVMTNALWRAQTGNVGEAMLWFSEAASLSRDQPEELRKNLVLCQSWLEQHPLPVAATLFGTEYCNDQRPDEIQFCPTAPLLFYRSASHVMVWNYAENWQWEVAQAFPEIYSVTWSPHGPDLVIGCRDGRVLKIDVNSRGASELLNLSSRVTQVNFAGDNRIVLASGKNAFLFDLERGALIGEPLPHSSTLFRLITNQAGDRLVTVDAKRQSFVCEVTDAGLIQRMEAHCQYHTILDSEKNIWPRFFKEDQAILLRTDESHAIAIDANAFEVVARIPLSRPTHSLSVSPDGDYFITGCINDAPVFRFGNLNDAARTVDRLPWTESERLPHDDRVMTTAWGADGLIATAGWSNDVRLWRVSEPKPHQRRLFDEPEKAVPIAILPHQTRIQRVAFSPDGSLLFTIQMDGLVRMWTIPDTVNNGYQLTGTAGGSIAKLAGPDQWLNAGMSRWNGHVANAELRRFDNGSTTGGTQTLNLGTDGHLLDSALSPDGRTLVTVHAAVSRSGSTFDAGQGKSGSIRFWNPADGTDLNQRIELATEPRWVGWHPDGKRIVVCNAKMELSVIDGTSFQIINTLATPVKQRIGWNTLLPRYAINETFEFSPDGRLLVGWTTNRPGLWIWNLSTDSLQFPVMFEAGPPVSRARFSSDGKFLAVAGGRSSEACVIDLETGKLAAPPLVHGTVVHSVDFGSDDEQLLTGCRDGHARVYDWRSGELLIDSMTHQADVIDAQWTPDQKYVATLGMNHQLSLWHAGDGSLALRPFALPAGSSEFVISGDSRYAVVSGGDIRVISLESLDSSPVRSLEAINQISELLSNQRMVDGQSETLSAGDWLDCWQQYQLPRQRF